MAEKKKIGVILSGSGVYDGSEIHEAVAALVALEKYGLEAKIMAPDIEQMHVVNHLTGEVQEGETRNVLVEAARIARGNITALTKEALDEIDGLMFVGGFGAAKNLSDYAVKGVDMSVQVDVQTGIEMIRKQGKPIAALCISPILLAKVLGTDSPSLTLGQQAQDAENLQQLGGIHQVTTHEEITVDEKLKLISGPCYMLEASLANIMNGADEVVKRLKDFLS
ncbi:MAG: isoprenoid biosynthesis protein ElbB [SAR324 cluster bacterium]|uniref:Isoprenoid biosynthesis protein ElbB n=1 Tax=SAR324 cluster bacterium TaxID=2024889 RepID=A0A2A4SRF1_9DELT|nr:MAG: isoprenoid biosynthesis protein ElbB [SAR324 cluster bacterium]